MPGKPDIEVTPNPIKNLELSIIISGSGFRPETDVQVGLFGYHPENGKTDSEGEFSIVYEHEGGIQGPIVGNELIAYAYGVRGNKATFITESVFVE